MSSKIVLENGTAKNIGGKDIRTIMASGGGCANWSYVETTTDTTLSLMAYGYADATYNYEGTLIAIQLQ